MYRRVLPALLLLLLSAAALGITADEDGLSTWEEITHGTSPINADTDGDGLNDSEELQIGTSPTVADTDGDDISDAAERRLGLNPTNNDSDDDGVEDGREFRLNTSPSNGDSDSDGLADVRELALNTSPTAADTDGDGLLDGREVALATEPTTADTDSDGLIDGDEVMTYETNPRLADTDNDTVDDGAEIMRYSTNPTAPDTDNDSLADGNELAVGTNPTAADTDNDGLSDGVEVYADGPAGEGDPLQKDIFIEVSYANGTAGLPSAARSNITTTFQSAPIANPNNERGVDVHFTVDDSATSLSQNVSLEAFWDEGVDNQTHQYQGKGVYHVLIVQQAVVGNQTVFGGYSSGDDSVIVTEGPNATVTGTRALHEIGHMFGIEGRNGDVVDDSTPRDVYPSVMNYDVVGKEYIFADGSESERAVNDWGIIRLFANPPETNTIHLNTTESATQAAVEEQAAARTETAAT